MNQNEYESIIAELQQKVNTLQKANLDLVSHNLLISTITLNMMELLSPKIKVL